MCGPPQAGRTALFYAASQGAVAVIDELVRRGANVNTTDNKVRFNSPHPTDSHIQALDII